MILVVDNNEIMSASVARVLEKLGKKYKVFDNVIEAVGEINNFEIEMVFLEALLTGPDGFTFLNEMSSYADTMNVPIILMSAKDFSKFDLSEYNVKKFLNKNTMTPEEIERCVGEFGNVANGAKGEGGK